MTKYSFDWSRTLFLRLIRLRMDKMELGTSGAGTYWCEHLLVPATERVFTRIYASITKASAYADKMKKHGQIAPAYRIAPSTLDKLKTQHVILTQERLTKFLNLLLIRWLEAVPLVETQQRWSRSVGFQLNFVDVAGETFAPTKIEHMRK